MTVVICDGCGAISRPGEVTANGFFPNGELAWAHQCDFRNVAVAEWKHDFAKKDFIPPEHVRE